MKIMGVICTIVMCMFIVLVCQGFKDLKRENVCIESIIQQQDYSENGDEYGCNDNDLHEYEHFVCDQVIAPKPSAGMVLGIKMAGYILIKFIMLKEALRRYCMMFKNMINTLVQCVVS